MTRRICPWLFAMLGLLLGNDGRSARAALPERTLELRDTLAQRIDYAGLDDNKATLMDVLDQLAKQVRANLGVQLTFDVNDNAFKAEQIMDVGKTEVANPALPPMKATLCTVLKKILSRIPVPSRAVHVVRNDCIEITTGAYLIAKFYLRSSEGPRPPLVIAGFQRCPLDQALNELASQSSCNVILDVRADKAGKALVTADLFNVPFDEAVLLLADMAGLESVRVGRTCYVTTRDNARALREARERAERARVRRKKELRATAKPGPRPLDGVRDKSVSPALDKPGIPRSSRGVGK